MSSLVSVVLALESATIIVSALSSYYAYRLRKYTDRQMGTYFIIDSAIITFFALTAPIRTIASLDAGNELLLTSLAGNGIIIGYASLKFTFYRRLYRQFRKMFTKK